MPSDVDNIRDVRVSLKETVIRSLECGRLSVHRKLPHAESLKDCMERTIPYWVDEIEKKAIHAGVLTKASIVEERCRTVPVVPLFL